MRRVVTGIVRHEGRLLAGIGLWVAGRTHGLGGGGRAFGYARGQGAALAGFGFVCVVETVAMAVLLRAWPVAHTVVLVLDVYTLVFVVGLYAAWQVRPHVLDAGTLRIRGGTHVDLRVPLARIAAVRRETRHTHERADGELNLPVGSLTTVTLVLAEPVVYTGPLGRGRPVGLVRLHADDPDGLVREVAAALTRA
ncbi:MULTISPECIES: hypothetical protein [unclassified Streptomyces]|uniref:hypothetical protein n=1 Tax=unclassified Streptomyces TaxID=2593676 RepID=UPI0038106C26